MDADQIAQRFPLVARPRPACPPLNERVREIGDLARSASGQTDGGLAQAAAAHNKAALIASDCGLPDLARSLCWRHSEVYLRAQPLGAQAARYALEPLVNLARLLIRDGDGDGAYHLLDTLFQTVKSHTDATIGGRRMSFQHLTETDDDHRALCQWLWTVLLADGTRALTSAGRWNDAHTHLQQHKGIGRRMLDGRQVAVIARATTGDADGALALLKETAPGEPWENAVTACLTVLCRRYADQPVDQDLAAMLDRYQLLEPTPHLAVFGTRLGLSAIDAAGGVERPGIRGVAADLIHQTMTSRDGYAAREVLAHNGCASLLTDRQAHELAEVVDACALGNRAIPPGLRADLSTALETSEVVLTRTLTGRPPTANSAR
jgi:hypothetical protein